MVSIHESHLWKLLALASPTTACTCETCGAIRAERPYLLELARRYRLERR